MMHTYQVVQMPTESGVVYDVRADSFDDVRAWAYANVDTTCRHLIKLDDKYIGSALRFTKFKALATRVDSHVFDHDFKSTTNGWFDTPEEAHSDRARSAAEAKLRLDAIVVALNNLKAELDFDLDYTMEGDTHGIYEDHQYISVTVGAYRFDRVFE